MRSYATTELVSRHSVDTVYLQNPERSISVEWSLALTLKKQIPEASELSSEFRSSNDSPAEPLFLFALRFHAEK